MRPNGLHAFLDFFNCRENLSAEKLKRSAEKVCRESGLKIIGKPHVAKFKKGGSTIVCILKKSHLVVHAYPEIKYFNVDIYACGKFNLKKIVIIFSNELGAERSKVRLDKI